MKHTALAEVEFVLAGAREMNRLVEEARTAHGTAEEALLKSMRAALPGIEALQADAALDAANTPLHRVRVGQQIAESITSPPQALAGARAGEALDRKLADRWARRMSCVFRASGSADLVQGGYCSR